MNRIDILFQRLKAENKKAFIAYITAGDPDLESTLKIMNLFVNEGVDAIELGVPFSDPIGDGPVNQTAAERALKKGTTFARVMEVIGRFREQNQETPVILFTYLNPLYQFGFSTFVEEGKRIGIDGVLMVDSPFDMWTEFRESLNKNNIYTIYLAAPTTTEKRIKKIAGYSKGFIYYISSLGVTGEKKFSLDLKKRVSLIKKISNKPVCVGFGVSNPKDAKEVSAISDGVIVGSAFMRLIHEGEAKMIESLLQFTRDMVRSVKCK